MTVNMIQRFERMDLNTGSIIYLSTSFQAEKAPSSCRLSVFILLGFVVVPGGFVPLEPRAWSSCLADLKADGFAACCATRSTCGCCCAAISHTWLFLIEPVTEPSRETDVGRPWPLDCYQPGFGWPSTCFWLILLDFVRD